jgi:hypothetical protein
MMVAADLMRRGYKIAFPYGEDWDFDLIVCRDGTTLERVQGAGVSFNYVSPLRGTTSAGAFATPRTISTSDSPELPFGPWGHSSVGRAPPLHGGGRRFESGWLHSRLRLST